MKFLNPRGPGPSVERGTRSARGTQRLHECRPNVLGTLDFAAEVS